MDHYFIFNDINSLDFDIVVDENDLPPLQIAQDEVELVSPPGMDGFLTLNKQRREPIDKQIYAVLINKEYKENVRKWLKSSGKLILSNESDVFFEAKILTPVQFIPHWSGGFEFTIDFKCQPQAYLFEGQDMIEIDTKNTILCNLTDVPSKPHLKIYGDGDVELLLNDTISRYTLDDYIEIDSHLMLCYKDETPKEFSGKFPTFFSGENHISWDGNVEKIEVIPRWQR